MLSNLVPGSKPVQEELKVTEDEASQWLALIPEFKTAASYKSHLKLACAVAKESVAWDTPLVQAGLKTKMKKSPDDVKQVRWACRKEQLWKMVEWADANDMEWFSVMLIVSYICQWRVYSGFFRIAYIDIRFFNMDRPLGEQSLE